MRYSVIFIQNIVAGPVVQSYHDVTHVAFVAFICNDEGNNFHLQKAQTLKEIVYRSLAMSSRFLFVAIMKADNPRSDSSVTLAL